MTKRFVFAMNQTGYDKKPTVFTFTVKDIGTDPDIQVYQEGAYEGELTLSREAAKEVADTLYFLLGKEPKP